jgi:uncharacterized protein
MRASAPGGARGMTAANGDPPDRQGDPALSTRARLARIALGLAIGVVGGLVFRSLAMPLPWMLGALVFNTIAAVLRVPIRGPTPVRPYVVVVIGVMLGSGFTPEIVGQLGAWTLSLAFLAVYLALMGLIIVPYYRRVGGFDPVTAYFSGMPGGLNEMMLVGKQMGGDERKIVLAHASRILVVVCFIALWFRVVVPTDLGDRARFATSFLDIPAVDLAILAACGVMGFYLGRLLRLPAPTLVGPMLLSALVHVTGLTASPAPSEIVALAQLFLGTIMGARFVGAAPSDIGRAILLSVGATAIMMTVTLVFAVFLHDLFGQSQHQVLLAYAPGGLAEMSLVALAMNAEVAYVASHHMVRITLVILFAPLAFSLLRRFIKKEGGGSGKS